LKNVLNNKLLLAWLPFGLWALMIAAMAGSGRQPTGDAPHLLGTAMRLGWELRTLQLTAFFPDLLTLLTPHPPGAYVLPAVLYAVLGPLDVVPLLASAISLALIWDAMLRMLRVMGARGAWVLAVCVAAAPLVWGQVELCGVDLLAAAPVAQCLSRLMTSRGLTVRAEAIKAGVWLGVGFWVKFTFPLFLLLPCLLVAAWVIVDSVRGRPGTGARIRNGLWLVLALALSAGPLLLIQARGIYDYVLSSLAPTSDQEALIGDALADTSAGMTDFDKYFFYLAALKDLWGWPGLLLLAAGISVAVWRLARGAQPEHWRGAAALALCCSVGGLLLLSVIPIRMERYMLPVLFPLLALLVALLPRRRLAALPVLGVMLPPLALVVADYSGVTHGVNLDDGFVPAHVNGAPTSAPPHRRLDYLARDKLAAWGRYPLPEERYRPISQDFSGWDLSAALRHVAANVPPSAPRVGLLVQDELWSPSFGVWLMAAERQGHHLWDFVTVKLLPAPSNPAGVRDFYLIGPFSRGQPPDFSVLIAVHGHDPSPLIRGYLSSRSFSRVYSRGHGVSVVRVLKRGARTRK